MVMDEFVLRLSETTVEDGELTFAGSSRLTGAMQLLATRIGRGLVGQEGPGRSPQSVESATELRLRAQLPGSTVLTVVVGEQNVLGPGLEHQMVDRMFELFSGVASDTPPPGTSAAVGSAVVQVVDALSGVSGRCELFGPGRSAVPFVPGAVSRSVWPTEDDAAETRADASVSGRLDRVDLRQARFRIRDAVGNDITLDRVADADEAGQLVGRTVTATGEASLGARGQIVSLTGASIVAVSFPEWSAPVSDLSDAVAPPSGGIPGVTEAEVRDFLASIRE